MSSFPPPDFPLEAVPPRGFGRWPLWAKIAGPAVVLLVGFGVVGSMNKGKSDTPLATDAPTSSIRALADLDTVPATTTAAAPATSTPATVAPTTVPPTEAPTAAPTVPPTPAPTVAPTVPPPPPTQAATDPRYDTCKEAKAHGFGPYVRGQDPEYDWYRDADGDGIVCE